MCTSFCLGIVLVVRMAVVAEAGEPTPSLRLPVDVPPVIAVWGWRESDFALGGYEAHIEMFARHSGVNLLATTILRREDW